MLLRYFIENISRFFDVSEPIQYFRVDIPQRARTNATLANAMLALSSRILQWKAGYSPHVADRYYQKCLEALIPALGDEALVMDDTLLAATIFLRMLEEMDSHISALDDGGRHLSGTHAIISIATTSSTSTSSPPTGFRLAAYWTAFRQELWLALHKRQPVTLSVRRVCGFENVDGDGEEGFAPAPDWTWCQRAIAHCGDKKARRDVRILCGIGLSNDAVPPAILISCMAVTLFADRFTDQAEQERLYMVLLETERRHGWPTAKARAQLKELWGC
ncbi:putative arca-like protein [Diplodia seriata]|uniref:Putative arca-like protein n=1 Tax=Diplodia seriata TaxID=420778 RepID=A0A0G2DZV6_9PEZI|nr:putative arca-like protein [Diplodia seriata]